MHKNSRRDFLKFATLGSALFFASLVSPLRRVSWAQSATIKGASYMTPSYRAIRQGMLGFVEQLQKQSQGSPLIEFFDSGTLLKADEQIEGLQEKLVHFIFHTSTYISSDYPILGIMNLPGLCDDLYRNGERLAMESPLWNLINDELAKDNLFMLSAGGGTLEPQYVWSGKKSVLTLEDLKGKRCRVVGYEAKEIMKKFGSIPVRIPSSQAYLALQRGTVDAMVANISTVIARNLFEQFQYCYQLPVNGLSIGVFLLRDHWDEMSEEYREIFWKAGQWYDANQASVINQQLYPREYWPIIKKNNIQVVQPTAAEREQFMAKAEPIWEWWRSQVGVEAGTRAIELAMGSQ